MIRELNVLGRRTREIDDAVRIVGEAVVHRHIDRASVLVVLHFDHGAERQVVVRCGPALRLINGTGGGVMARIMIRNVGGITTHFIGGFGAAGQQSGQRDGKESKKRGVFHDLLFGE